MNPWFSRDGILEGNLGPRKGEERPHEKGWSYFRVSPELLGLELGVLAGEEVREVGACV